MTRCGTAAVVWLAWGRVGAGASLQGFISLVPHLGQLSQHLPALLYMNYCLGKGFYILCLGTVRLLNFSVNLFIG